MTKSLGKQKDDVVVVHIPVSLFHLIEQRAKEMGFVSGEEYVLFVLIEVTKEEDEVHQEQVELTSEEESKVIDRLRGLGYVE